MGLREEIITSALPLLDSLVQMRLLLCLDSRSMVEMRKAMQLLHRSSETAKEVHSGNVVLPASQVEVKKVESRLSAIEAALSNVVDCMNPSAAEHAAETSTVSQQQPAAPNFHSLSDALGDYSM